MWVQNQRNWGGGGGHSQPKVKVTMQLYVQWQHLTHD